LPLAKGHFDCRCSKSIQAQTISNLYLVLENDLEIIPVLNKVDLPSANPEEVSDDIVDLLGCKLKISFMSGKTGLGVEYFGCCYRKNSASKEMLMSHYKL
jgi:translation elongation factor EF-4